MLHADFDSRFSAQRSNELPMTARCLLSLPGFKSPPGHLREFSVTWELGGSFYQVLNILNIQVT